MTELEKRIRAVLWPVETAEDTFTLAMEAAKIATEIERERCLRVARAEADTFVAKAQGHDGRAIAALRACMGIVSDISTGYDPEAK